jgi:hypothetical protein
MDDWKENEKVLFDKLSNVADLTEQEIADTLKADIEAAIAQGSGRERVLPRLIPYDKNGNRIDLEKYTALVKKHVDSIENLVGEIFLIADPEGIAWSELSAINTSVAGTASGGGAGALYKRTLNKSSGKAKERMITINKQGIENISVDDLAAEAYAAHIAAKNASGTTFQYGALGAVFLTEFIDITKSEAENYYKAVVIFKGFTPPESKGTPNRYKLSELTITQGEVIFWEVPSSATLALNIEHSSSDVGRYSEEYITDIRNFLAKVEQYAAKTNDPKASKVVANLRRSVQLMEVRIKALDMLSNQVGEQFPSGKVDEVMAFYTAAIERGEDLGFHVLYRDSITHSLQARSVKVDATIEAKLKNNKNFFFLGRARANGIKGNVEKAFVRSLPSLLWRRRSPSLVAVQIYNALIEIFNLKAKNKFAKNKNSKQLGKDLNIFIKFAKKAKLNFKYDKVPTELEGRAKRKKRSNPTRVNTSNFGGQSIPTQQMLPILNAEIKQYVINEMGRPSLENRSGRFAGSVRVLSAQENAAVQYTYQKFPYQVFSPSKGRRPWATEERDPAKIIDRAIKKLGQDRFQKVFRTEER